MSSSSSSAREALQATFAVRLNQSLDRCASIPTQGHGRTEAVARFLDIPFSTVQRLLVGAVLPEVHRLAAIAERLGVTTDYLLGRASLDESQRNLEERSGRAIPVTERQYVAIPILNPDPELRDESFFHLPRAHLRRYIQPVEAAALIVMRGDSMEPTFRNGELLFISLLDQDPAAILPEGLYPLRRRDCADWTMRRLQAVGKEYRLSCDNPAYPAQLIPRSAFAEDGDSEWLIAGQLKTHFHRF